jgi:hypothetical protein
VTSEEAGMFDYAISCTHDAQTLPAAQAGTSIFFGNIASGSFYWWLLLALTLALGLGLVLRVRIRQASQ